MIIQSYNQDGVTYFLKNKNLLKYYWKTAQKLNIINCYGIMFNSHLKISLKEKHFKVKDIKCTRFQFLWGLINTEDILVEKQQ